MSKGLAFWILMLIALVFGLWFHWPLSWPGVAPLGMTLLVWVLLALLGWQVFGAAIK